MRGLLVGLDGRRVRVIVQRLAKLLEVHADRRCIALEGGALEAVDVRLMLEEELAHLREAVASLLHEDLVRRFSRELSVKMHRERQVPPHHLDLAGVRLEELVDGRLRAAAERALEVGKLLDHDLRVGGPAERRRPRARSNCLLFRRRSGLAVLDDRVVDRRARHAAPEERLGLRHLRVDERLELLEGLRADDAMSVDEEVRRATRLDVVGEGLVVADALRVCLVLDRCVDLRGVDADGPCHRREVRVLELGLRVEELVVRGPERAVALLRARRACQLRRRQRAWMERQRRVLPHEADAVAVFGTETLERRLHLLAVRALEVAELDDGHERRDRAAHRGRPDRDLPHRGVGLVVVVVVVVPGEAGLLVVRRHHAPVDPVASDAAQREVFRLDQLRVDDLLEFLERLRAGERDTVDERRGGPAGADALRQRLVVLDLLGPCLVREPLLDLARVGARRDGPGADGVRTDELLPAERHVVVAPERVVALRREDRLADLGGEARVGMEGERLVLEYDANVVAVGLGDALESGREPSAERTLEVGEDDDGDVGEAIAAHGIVGADRDRGVVLAAVLGRRSRRDRQKRSAAVTSDDERVRPFRRSGAAAAAERCDDEPRDEHDEHDERRARKTHGRRPHA